MVGVDPHTVSSGGSQCVRMLEMDVLHGFVYFLTTSWALSETNTITRPSVICVHHAQSRRWPGSIPAQIGPRNGGGGRLQVASWPHGQHIHNRTPSLNMVSTPLKQSVPGVKLDSEPENDVLANCHFSERVMIDCFIIRDLTWSPILHNGQQKWEFTIKSAVRCSWPIPNCCSSGW